jgi:hypothetical protein
MMTLRSAQSQVEAALWGEATAFMREHGDAWAERAMDRFRNLVQREDLIGSEHWSAVVERMIQLSEAPKQ